MPDLNEVVENVVRRKWDRSNLVTIKNEYKQAPQVQFNMTTACEEDGVYKGSVPKGFIDVSFDPTEVYPLLNPLDDSVLDPTGGSHFMAQAQLYSLLQYKLGKI